MADESFLVNPPKRIRRKVRGRRRRNPIGETLVTIGANPSRRNPMGSNPWFGDSGGHRIAALMRWGKIPRGKVKRHRKRGRPRVKTVTRVVKRRHIRRRRRVVHVKRGRWAPFAVRQHRKIAQQAFWADKYGEILAHPRRKKYHYKKRGVKFYMRRTKRRRHRKSNTWFGQPRRHRRAAKKGWRKGHMLSAGKRRRRVRHANPMVGATANPRRRHHRKRHTVRHRRSHRRNPAMGAMLGKFTGGVMNVRSWGPLAITGGLSAITGAVVPGMLGVSGWAKYGVQIGVAVGGGIVVERVVSKEHGQAWMVVGAAMVAYSLLKEFVLQPYFPQFAVGLGAQPGQYETYYPDTSSGDVSQRIDAFPSGIHAFPSAVGAYPGVGEAGSYPYDGAGY